jgi:hypothetical protein
MSISRDTLLDLLKELDQWLEFNDVEPIELVVCGGVAMALQNLNTRTTRDVDVLGTWHQGLMQIASLTEFPPGVRASIARVAQNHPELRDLGKDWVNLGPTELARRGLPKGFESRLQTTRLGKKLVLHLLSRADLIPLKLYAASDRFSLRQAIHLDDLKLLKASFDELDKALDWVKTLPDYEEKIPEIQNVLERLGFDDLAQYI